MTTSPEGERQMVPTDQNSPSASPSDVLEDSRKRPMKIALLSDTHVPQSLPELPGALLDQLQDVDRILHAGDLVSEQVLEALESFAPVTAVTGNMDPPELRRKLADRQLLELAGRTIGLAHGHQPHSLQSRYIGGDYEDEAFDLFFDTMKTQLPEAEIIAFGHFHKPVITRRDGVLFVNPGSIAPPHRRATFALLELGSEVAARIVDL